MEDLRQAYKPDVEGEGPLMCLCPVHGDQNPSLALYRDGAHCFGCGLHQDADTFLAQHPPGSLVIRYQSRGSSHQGMRTGKPKPTYLPKSMVETYHRWLMTGRFSHRKGWLLERGLTEETLERRLLGHSLSAFTIPVFDVLGRLRTVRYRRDDEYWDGEGGSKYWGTGGANETVFYLAENILRTGPIYLCEGELDAALLSQEGLLAVSGTNGNRGLPGNLVASLRGRTVYICYDQDEAGRAGAERLLAMLPEARIVAWDIQLGKDVTEVLQRVSLRDFKEMCDGSA